MFIDQEWKKEQQKALSNDQSVSNKPWAGLTPNRNKNLLYYFILGLVVIANGAIIFLFWLMPRPTEQENNINQNQGQTIKSTSTIGGLPSELGNGNGSDTSGSTTANMKIEDITFGFFYQPLESKTSGVVKDYKLPLNIKTDVANYYDVARKINLDDFVSILNQDGYAIIKADANKKFIDFFAAYRSLSDDQVPVVITNDFLFYYYQNTLKRVFKEIETNAFYDNVWNINKKLYDISLARYRKRLASAGGINDPVLEAERLETAYFATALKLLMPKAEQLGEQGNLADDNKFAKQDAEKYYFEMPEAIASDVNKEVDLIKKAAGEFKSPIMLYQKSYDYFKVPAAYKTGAKLNNFYLAIKWLNTVFPLYYRGPDCPNCLLDYDDWVINLAAANFIAKDLYENQEIKNEWAIVYKFVAFFTGLRKDLTYLQYYNAWPDKTDREVALEDIFSAANTSRGEQIKKYQQALAVLNFSALEGGLDRNNQALKPTLGMRILQEPYWPNGYIFDQLVSKDIISGNIEDVNMPFTACGAANQKDKYRCRGFGLDIVNLLATDKSILNSNYYLSNTGYKNYDTKIQNIKNQLDNFNVNSWNDNVYWATLGLSKTALSYDQKLLPVYALNQNWRAERDINTVLGSWANVHMPADQWTNYYEQSGSNLDNFSACNMNNYVEPNLVFINDLLARNNMLIKILDSLRVTNRTYAAVAQLKDFDAALRNFLSISQKELADEAISEEDCKFLNDFIRRYIVAEKNDRTYTINFKEKNLRVSVNGVKLLTLIYQRHNQNIIAVGPLFNYMEAK